MVIVDGRNLIRQSLEDHGLGFYDFNDDLTVVSVRDFCELPLTKRSDVVLIDAKSLLSNTEKLESCKAVINTFQGAYFFYDSNESTSLSWIKEQASFFPKILGAFSLSMNDEDWILLGNQMQFFWNLTQEQKMLQKHIVHFSLELDQVLQSVESELVKTRRIHKSFIPQRVQEIKGLNFLVKYTSGDHGGAEFCDIIEDDDKVFQILISSESYLISSSLLGILNAHKSKSFDPEDFLRDAWNDVQAINNTKKKKSLVEVLVLEIDLHQLLMKSYGSHKNEIFSTRSGIINLEHDGSYQLSKKERVMVLSSGFLSNWSNLNINQSFQSFVQNHPEIGMQELMTEIFYQIRKESKEMAARRDATLVMMEVNRHGIHKV